MTAPLLQAGQVIAGRYSVRGQLALSQAVATYLAQDQQGREVVLKVFDPALGQRADLMTSLERATTSSRQLPAESVVHVVDSGYDQSTGAPYSVTERLQIPSLLQLVAQGPVGADVASAIASGMARALDLAHSRGLMHHALKPANVFVGAPPGYGVRIADFGSAIVRGAVPTHEAYMAGAPWWAPEQIQPGATLTAATDVFAAALVMFYALTGHSYWLAFQQTPADLHAWQRELLGPRVPISQRAMEMRVPINGALDGIFGRALAVNPADRPRSVGELATAIATLGVAQKAGESAKTVAFDALPYQPPTAAPGGAGYPPAPTGGAYAPPAASAPVAMQAQPSVVVSAAATGSPSEAAQAPAAAAGLPPFPLPPRREKKKKGIVPILIGVAVALVGGGVGLALLMSRGPGGDAAAAGTASATATQAATAAESATSATGDSTASATETVTSSDTASDSTASSSEPADAGADAETEDAGVETVVAKLTCNDGPCDFVYIDGQQVKDLTKDIELPVGEHRLRVAKLGYLPQEEVATVEAGKPYEKAYTLTKAPTQPAKKPCGKFTRRCD